MPEKSVGFDLKSQNQSHIPPWPHLALPGQAQGKVSMASGHNRKPLGGQSPAGHNRPEKLQSFSWNQSQCQTDRLEHRQGEDRATAELPHFFHITEHLDIGGVGMHSADTGEPVQEAAHLAASRAFRIQGL